MAKSSTKVIQLTEENPAIVRFKCGAIYGKGIINPDYKEEGWPHNIELTLTEDFNSLFRKGDKIIIHENDLT